jgi:hypothetical protein
MWPEIRPATGRIPQLAVSQRRRSLRPELAGESRFPSQTFYGLASALHCKTNRLFAYTSAIEIQNTTAYC